MNIKDIIEYKDEQYIVIGKVEYENMIYYYLASTKRNDNFKFCYIDNNNIVELDDTELIQNLLPIFSDQILNEMNNYLKES